MVVTNAKNFILNLTKITMDNIKNKEIHNDLLNTEFEFESNIINDFINVSVHKLCDISIDC